LVKSLPLSSDLRSSGIDIIFHCEKCRDQIPTEAGLELDLEKYVWVVCVYASMGFNKKIPSFVMAGVNMVAVWYGGVEL
jgi:hypothetical protein